MTQTTLDFSNKPTPSDLGLKPGSQKHRIYERLLQGPITNGEIIYQLRVANSTGRCSELREMLRPYLIDLECKRVEGSEFEYRLRG